MLVNQCHRSSMAASLSLSSPQTAVKAAAKSCHCGIYLPPQSALRTLSLHALLQRTSLVPAQAITMSHKVAHLARLPATAEPAQPVRPTQLSPPQAASLSLIPSTIRALPPIVRRPVRQSAFSLQVAA